MISIEQRLKKYALYLLGRRAYSVYEMKAKIKEKIKKIEKYKEKFQMVHKVHKVSKVDKEKRDVLVIPPRHSEALKSEGWDSLRPREALESEVGIRDSDAAIENVISYLEELNLLNDEEFARAFVESLLRQNKSRGVIERKLMQKGIDKETITTVLVVDGDRESDVLKKLIESKTRNHPEHLNTPKGKQKLIRFLMYRGFKYEDIKKATQL